MTRRPTREECWAEAGAVIAEAEHSLRRDSVEEAAQRAWSPTGPPLEELARRIAEIRAGDYRRADLPVPAYLAPYLSGGEAFRAAAAAEAAVEGGVDT